MDKLKMVVAVSFLATLTAFVMGGDKTSNVKLKTETTERMVFREVVIDMRIKESLIEYAKIKAFIAIHGSQVFVLFDRSGNSGRNIVGADCRLLVRGEVKSMFQISHCAQNSRTMFQLKDAAQDGQSILTGESIHTANDDAFKLQIEKVTLQ